MKTSNQAIAKIKEFEGCRLKAYWDSYGGVWTIGYGHTKNVKRGQAITESLAEQYLRSDLLTAENSINKLGVCKTQGQFDALVDFAYNAGIGNLLSSTLLKKIKATAPTKEIQNQFKRWIYSGGKPLGGLIKRRSWEAVRWAE